MDLIEYGAEVLPPRVLLYGPEGIGKSTFCAEAEAVILPTEKGLGSIRDPHTGKPIKVIGFPLCTSFEDVMDALTSARTSETAPPAFAVDSLDWLERLIWSKVEDDYGVTSIEKADGGWGKGYKYALPYWRQVIAALDDLHTRKGCAIILTAHAQATTFHDPDGGSYDRWSPRLHTSEKWQDAGPLVCEWVDVIAFAHQKKRLNKDDQTKKVTAHSLGDERVLRVVGSPACVAKNRYGIRDEIPLSWAALVNAITPKTES